MADSNECGSNEIISEYANDTDSCGIDTDVVDACVTDTCTDSTDHIVEVLMNLAGRNQENSEYECSTPEEDEEDDEEDETDNQMANKDVLKVVSEMRVDMLQAFQLIAELNKEITCMNKTIKQLCGRSSNTRNRLYNVETSLSESDVNTTINDEFSRIQNEFDEKLDLMKKDIEEKIVEITNNITSTNIARVKGHAANSKTVPTIKVTTAVTKTIKRPTRSGVGYFQ